MKLKRKIFLIFSLVAVIPMIFLTTYTVVQYTHMIDNRMEDISHEQQENLLDAIDASYTSIRQVFMLLTLQVTQILRLSKFCGLTQTRKFI